MRVLFAPGIDVATKVARVVPLPTRSAGRPPRSRGVGGPGQLGPELVHPADRHEGGLPEEADVLNPASCCSRDLYWQAVGVSGHAPTPRSIRWIGPILCRSRTGLRQDRRCLCVRLLDEIWASASPRRAGSEVKRCGGTRTTPARTDRPTPHSTAPSTTRTNPPASSRQPATHTCSRAITTQLQVRSRIRNWTGWLRGPSGQVSAPPAPQRV